MGFFDSPEGEAPAEDDPFDNYDDGTTPWVPRRIDADRVLAQTSDAALVLSNVRVFAHVVAFEVTALLRHTVRITRDIDPFGNAWANSGLATTAPPETVRIGLEWPDGGHASNITRYTRANLPTEPLTYVLTTQSIGGGGTSRKYNWRYMAWPIPDTGDITLHFEWPSQAIAETETPFDGDALRAASELSKPLWPDDHARVPSSWDFSGW